MTEVETIKSRLADVDKLRRYFEMGMNAGLQLGFQQGWDAHGEQVDTWLGLTRAGLKLPTQIELERRRAYTNEPCNDRSCHGRCSRCIRAAAAIRNIARHGSPDYPGGPVQWGAVRLDRCQVAR
jgi:hypothetical protein